MRSLVYSGRAPRSRNSRDLGAFSFRYVNHRSLVYATNPIDSPLFLLLRRLLLNNSCLLFKKYFTRKKPWRTDEVSRADGSSRIMQPTGSGRSRIFRIHSKTVLFSRGGRLKKSNSFISSALWIFTALGRTKKIHFFEHAPRFWCLPQWGK